jgi:hypothetical protein
MRAVRGAHPAICQAFPLRCPSYSIRSSATPTVHWSSRANIETICFRSFLPRQFRIVIDRIAKRTTRHELPIESWFLHHDPFEDEYRCTEYEYEYEYELPDEQRFAQPSPILR